MIKEGLNKCKDIPCTSIGTLDIVEMMILLKVIYRVNALPIEIPVGFFTEIDKLILKFLCI